MKKLLVTPEGTFELDLTSEEIAQRQAEETAWNEGAFDRAIKELRNIRNDMLAKTDWYVTKAKENNEEVPVNVKQYRQALRDLTKGLTTVEQIKNIIKNNLYPTLNN